MIRDVGNVELFELCETIPKVQCSECLLYWNQGIGYCTCGHLLREKSSRHLHRMDIGSSLNPELCHREGTTSWQSSWEDWRTKKKPYCPWFKKEMYQKGFWRNSRSPSERFKNVRDSQLRIDRTEAKCIQMDEVAQKDFTAYRPKSMRDFRRPGPSLNTSGRNAPMKLRSDFSEALTKMHRLYRESGEERLATDSFLAVSEMAFVVLFIQHITVAVERSQVELMKFHQSQAPLSSWHERHHRTVRPR